MDNSIKYDDTFEKEQYACDICGERFETVVDLEEHKNKLWHNQLWHLDKDSETHGDIGVDDLPMSPSP